MKYICTKDLLMDNGDKSFSIGKIYESTSSPLTPTSSFVDDSGIDHYLGYADERGPSWVEYFYPENFEVLNK